MNTSEAFKLLNNSNKSIRRKGCKHIIIHGQYKFFVVEILTRRFEENLSILSMEDIIADDWEEVKKTKDKNETI